MICAKTPEALSWLQKQFAQRRTKKTYLASKVVNGSMNPEAAIIDMPIERNPKEFQGSWYCTPAPKSQ
jgi:23S rRNA-/tRNA-specific pseudouridylate synthase